MRDEQFMLLICHTQGTLGQGTPWSWKHCAMEAFH